MGAANREQLVKRIANIEAQRVENDMRSAQIDAERRRAIRDALAGGIGPTELARLTGLSRARIYQIRDGRR